MVRILRGLYDYRGFHRYVDLQRHGEEVTSEELRSQLVWAWSVGAITGCALAGLLIQHEHYFAASIWIYNIFTAVGYAVRAHRLKEKV